MAIDKYNKDYLVEPEDVVRDAIYNAVDVLPFANDFEVDVDKFFKEIHSRSKKVRIDLAFEILGSNGRAEFEEMIHKLYLRGVD